MGYISSKAILLVKPVTKLPNIVYITISRGTCHWIIWYYYAVSVVNCEVKLSLAQFAGARYLLVLLVVVFPPDAVDTCLNSHL